VVAAVPPPQSEVLMQQILIPLTDAIWMKNGGQKQYQWQGHTFKFDFLVLAISQSCSQRPKIDLKKSNLQQRS
jgi:hypothetical protein